MAFGGDKLKITVRLDIKSLDNAIQELNRYKQELQTKTNTIIEKLLSEGVEFAKTELISLGAIDTGILHDTMDSIMYYSESRGIIFTRAKHAMYVEFGTGIEGLIEPHPNPQGWEYDVNHHGWSGWIYYDEFEQKFRWTAGYMARPFMYNTARYLESIMTDIAKGVFK